MRLPFGRMHRGDHEIEATPGIPALLAKRRIIRAGQFQRELPAHLALPLLDQRRRRQHKGRPDQPAQAQLGEDQASLDGLAQADFVAQQGPPAEAL